MKICLLGPAYPLRGGIAHYTTLLYLELKQTHEVTLVSFKRQYPAFFFPGKSQTDESRESFRVENKPLLDTLNPWTWFATGRKIRNLAPDLLVIQWWHPYFALPFAAVALLFKRGGGRVCFICHNVLPHDRSMVDRFLTSLALRTGDRFIVHSKKDEEDLRKLRPHSPVERVMHPTYTPFSADKTLTQEAAREALGLNGKMLLFFGFIRPYKGLIHLIRALPRILESVDCVLYIVGEFYEAKEPYLREVERLGLGPNVRIVDRYVSNEEVPLYFCACDAVVLPYVSATQSGVVQMAYAFDKPVITTRVGGIPEAVREGVTGFLVPPGDERALADAVRAFYSGDESRFSNNVAEFKKQFSWGALREALEKSGNGTHRVPRVS
jgi:glycosyltransferase involved in cell wall biosynthesis